MNNQLQTSSNTRNQATIQDGRVVIQNVQGRQKQRYVARGNGAAGNGVLDKEELLFLAGEQANTFDADEDECDAFDSDVDDELTAQSIFMANLSSAGLANP
ncbi:hypothetical protein Tco_0183096 [Tanacetum coccineum]